MSEPEPDISKYSREELLDVARNIDRRRFPERAARIDEALRGYDNREDVVLARQEAAAKAATERAAAVARAAALREQRHGAASKRVAALAWLTLALGAWLLLAMVPAVRENVGWPGTFRFAWPGFKEVWVLGVPIISSLLVVLLGALMMVAGWHARHGGVLERRGLFWVWVLLSPEFLIGGFGWSAQLFVNFRVGLGHADPMLKLNLVNAFIALMLYRADEHWYMKRSPATPDAEGKTT